MSTPAPPLRFIADVHLGRLAHYLRMLGFDTLYDNAYTLAEQVRRAMPLNRMMLSRDPLLYKRSQGMPFYLVRSEDPREQLQTLLHDLKLLPCMRPFTRCMACNGVLEPVEKSAIEARLLPNTRAAYQEFWQCIHCSRLYWKGPHYQRMQTLIHHFSAP